MNTSDEHGTVNRYKNGACRCDACRAANSAYMRTKRREARERGFTDLTHGLEGTYNAGCRCDLCRRSRVKKHKVQTKQPPRVVFERRILGDALQIAGLIREHGPDPINQLLDRWGPDHIRNVCIALAAAVDHDLTPKQLWGWLGGVAPTTSTTVSLNKLFNYFDPHALRSQEIHDSRAVDAELRRDRNRARNQRGAA